ncbi:aspartic peptidase domain-containing protein [Lasiosphaeria hispida]|uniref:Aspartic peptidase domain-containing protein n=1 Tax=Lasiosphaeria hispida TaxID=260671 RepID=A0AAJ0H8L7_9PEZI|nr:aspartic peptidase domain-containing protein [Lasiosphaeria hispida]
MVALSSAVAAYPHVSDALHTTPPGVSFKSPKGTHPWTFSKFTKMTHNVQHMHGFRGSKTNAKSVAAVLGAHQRQVGGFGYENITTTTAYGTQYATNVLWNGHRMSLLLDTGSSDTWAVQRDFSCIDYAGELLPQVSCGFGPTYPEKFQYGETSPSQHMFIRYGDGEIVTGPMGFSDITVGNITIKKQEVCLANSTYWFGNNMTSGLMGLAFPSLTNAYLGSGLSHDSGSQIEYSPLFTSMVSQGKVPPLFSIAIDRNASSGMLAWGGIAPAAGLDTSKTASLPMIITNLVDVPSTAYEYSFYTIIPDGWEYGQATDTKKYPYIVDSGTTLCYLPPPLAEAINSAFLPSAVYLWNYGAYFTTCDAIAPQIAVKLDGILFIFNPVDLIYRDMKDPLTGLCMTAIASGGTGPYILGDVFMQNALVVFDIGQAQMRFIPRPYY